MIISQLYKIPILLNIFNRVETTKQVFIELRKIKPSKLYIAADGPRNNNNKDLENVKKVREYVLQEINWNCEIKTLFRDENLGCKYAISEAINWFFDFEEMGIILEDDCLPNQSFFWFCEQLLEKYKNDTRIMHISGSNFYDNMDNKEISYYYSRLAYIWGWATWRRAWVYYDVHMKSYRDFVNENVIDNVWHNKEFSDYWMKVFKNAYEDKLDTWDYQWIYTIFTQNGLCINPTVNMISNIGFGYDATHTQTIGSSAFRKTEELSSFIQPSFFTINHLADEYVMKKYFMLNRKSQILNKISGWLGNGFKSN